MKKLLAIGLLFALALTLLTACGGSGIVGSWTCTIVTTRIADLGLTMEFNKDGTYTSTSVLGTDTGTYKTEGGKLTLDGKNTYTYKLDGDTLTLTKNGISLNYTRNGE